MNYELILQVAKITAIIFHLFKAREEGANGGT